MIMEYSQFRIDFTPQMLVELRSEECVLSKMTRRPVVVNKLRENSSSYHLGFTILENIKGLKE